MEAGKKGPRTFWVALIVMGVVAVFAAGLMLVVHTARPGDGMAVLGADRIALLPLRGIIVENHVVLSQLRDYRRDRSIKGYVLWVNSPGGEVAPSQAIFRELRRVREEGKPVVAVIGSVGASGAYYAALGADSILAMPGSLVGSIGVVMEFPVAEELLDKIGLQFEVIKSAEHKDIGSPYRQATDADRALLQQVVDDVYGQFVEAIAEARGLPRDSVMTIADGRVLSGRSAMEYGLADGEGDLRDAIALAGTMAGLGPEPRTVLREERRGVTWFELFTSLARWAAGRDEAALLKRMVTGTDIDPGPRLMYLFRYP